MTLIEKEINSREIYKTNKIAYIFIENEIVLHHNLNTLIEINNLFCIENHL